MDTRLPDRITIDNDRRVVVIDGEDFPFAIAERGPSADSLVPEGGVFVVNIPVLAANLHIVGPTRPDLPDFKV